jgi:hypothetical protein
MGASRPPPTADVARRLAAAIAVAGTMLVALVMGAGSAAAGPQPVTGAASRSTLAAVPPPGTLQTAGDLFVATAPAPRGQGDPDAGWAEPATVSVLLAAPVGFFVGLTDTSHMGSTGRSVPQLRGRSPPAPSALAPR